MKLRRFLFLLATGLPLAAWGNAGEVRFAQGEVQVQRAGGKLERLERGSKLAEGDTIVTGAAGYAQLLMADEAVIAIRPDTRLTLETYRYTGAADGSEKGVLGLIRGGFRTLTGWIGRRNKDAYAVRTPTATIGIRGTDHEALVIPVPGPGEKPLGEPGTYDKVNAGQTYIETAAGRVDLGVNQAGFVAAQPGSAPVRLVQVPQFLRGTPPVRPEGHRPGRDRGATDRREGALPPPPAPPPAPLAEAAGGAGTLLPLLVPLLPLVEEGTIDPRYLPASVAPAAKGFVIAGGDLSPGTGLGNGAGIVGDAVNNLGILVNGAGLPVAISSSEFNYSRDGAPLVHQGSATVGGQAVNWGIYAGGTISDGQGVRQPQFFHFMAGGTATTPANLLAAMPGAGATLTFSSVGGYTKPINESGGVGGSVSSVLVELKNVGPNFVVSKWQVALTDAGGRNWTGNLPVAQGLGDFVKGGGNNLVTTCSGCAMSVGTGQVNGMVIGNPTPAGVSSSYTLRAGAAGVTGSVLAQ